MGKSSQKKYNKLRDVLLVAFGEEKQATIARKFYVSQPAVQKWESGDGRPSPANVGLIAAIYNLSPEYLASLAGYGEDVSPSAFDKVMNSYNDRRSASR